LTSELISISSSLKELKISITKEEFDGKHEQELKEIQQKIKMPGFRPGRVPTKLIKQQYGPALKSDLQDKTANEYFRNYLQTNDIAVLGTPSFSDIQENEDGSQVYIIKFETLPDFDLKDYKTLEIFEPYHKVTDKEIEDALNHSAKMLGERVEEEIVADYNYYVVTDSYLLDDAGEPTEDKPYLDMPIDLSLENIGEVRELFLNKKVNDEIKYFPDKEKNKGQRPEKFIIKKIEKIIPRELNDEFAKSASQDRFDNLEDYKQEIGFSLQKQWDERTRQLMEEQIISKVTELHEDIELPNVLLEGAREQIIKSYKKQNPNFDENDEEAKKYLDTISQKAVRVELVQDRIIKTEKIELEDYDYENFADDFLLKHAEMGMGQTLPKDIILQHIKTDENLKGNLLKKKYVDFLLDFTKTNEIDYNEYINKNIPKEEDNLIM